MELWNGREAQSEQAVSPSVYSSDIQILDTLLKIYIES